MAKRKGATSSTPIERTRAAIDKLLREWGCRRISWSDDFEEGIVEVAFVFLSQGGSPLCARFTLRMVSDDPNLNTQAKIEADQRGRFRTLYYWLQGALDAVDAGIVPADQLFMPWLIDDKGRTFYEAVAPRLEQLSSGSGFKLLLGAGK